MKRIKNVDIFVAIHEGKLKKSHESFWANESSSISNMFDWGIRLTPPALRLNSCLG